jgi:membrane protein
VAFAGQPPSAGKVRLADRWTRLVHIYQREIWQSAFLEERSVQGWFYAVLRVVSITVTVFNESRIMTRAAALSFSSLLGLGPLLVISVLVAGFALGKNEPDIVANTLNNLIKLVAPQIAQYEQVTQTANEVNPQLVEIITNIIDSSKSGSAGAASVFSILLIVLLLFKNIEDTFNDFWGVRQGRSVLMRVVLYWTILTLGAILFFTAVAMLGAGTFVSVFEDLLPAGVELKSVGIAVQFLSFGLLAIMLALFYRVIPNTRVFWGAAFIGGVVVSALLLANNLVQLVYVKRVLLERSLYGSLAIVPVLMAGLYVFWLFVLIGGVVSYAIQNVHFRNSQAAWSTLTESMRERMTLAVFLTICRRFRDCLPPISVSELSEMLKVPSQLLNECLNRLVKIQLVTTLRPPPHSTATDYLYQPARPLNRITLYDFKTLDDNLGEDPVGTSLEKVDPLVPQYESVLNRAGENDFFKKTVEELFNEFPYEEPRPALAATSQRLAGK